MKATWAINQRDVASRDDLAALIEAVRASGQPTMIFLEADDGTSLVFGVGHAESVLTFASPDGISFHSKGDPNRRGFLRFLCRDQIDEFFEEMAVPERHAVDAALEFLETQAKPSAVTWEPDW